MSKNTAQFPTSVWDGGSPHRAADSTIDREPDYEDWDQIVAEVQAVETELTSNLDGSNVKVAAAADVVGGIPVLHFVTIGNAAGDTDVVLTHKTRVVDVWAVKTAAGGATDTVTVKNGATAITNALDLNVADKAVVRASEIDDAQHVIAAGGTLRVTAVDGSDPSCIVYVLGVRVA